MAKEEPKEKEEGKEGADAAAKPKGKKKLFIIIGAVVLLVAAAGVPLMLMGGSKEAKEGEEAHVEEHEEKHIETVGLDTFIVNLSENGAFLKVKMLMEYDHSIIHKAEEELAKKGGGEAEGGGGHGGGKEGGLSGYLKHREPMIRDTVIRILSSKRPTEMLSRDGKDKLKEELIEGLNEAIALEEGPVQGIYFTEFIIQ